ncbi:MAG TPA: hypothetical protein VE218_14255 [Acidobacteriaceae bacterium]|nr:hypothetical protein [Acidobacteriaceae bacterium]
MRGSTRKHIERAEILLVAVDVGFGNAVAEIHHQVGPVVSQHFTEFAMIKPDPAKTWEMVEKFAAGKPVPACNLFGSWHHHPALPQGPLPDLSTQLLQLSNSNGQPLLIELPLRAIPTTPNLYLDEGESTTATFQINDRGVPVKISIPLMMFRLDSAGDGGWQDRDQFESDKDSTINLSRRSLGVDSG